MHLDNIMLGEINHSHKLKEVLHVPNAHNEGKLICHNNELKIITIKTRMSMKKGS